MRASSSAVHAGDKGDNCVNRTLKRRYAWATTIVIAGIIYASLFPFHFHRPPGVRGALETLVSSWNYPPGRGDLVANILLYTPFGLLAGLSLCRGPALVRAGLVTAAGATLSITLELTQFYDVSREPAMSDVYANTVGTLLGVIAASVIARRGRLTRAVNIERRPFALILIGSWLAYQLFPYVPVIDLHKYWNAIKPLIFSFQISAAHAYYLAACWLALGAMIEEIAGAAASRAAMALLIGFVLVGRMLISGIALSADEVIGAAAAGAAWIVVISQIRNRSALIALAIMAAVIVRGLQPFTFQAPPRPFEWIPFRGFIDGSPDHGVPSFFQKTFLYGAMLWAMTRVGLKLRVATTLAAGIVFALSFAHRYLPERSCEITDALMVLILAGVFRIMEHPVARQRVSLPAAALRRRNSAALAE